METVVQIGMIHMDEWDAETENYWEKHWFVVENGDLGFEEGILDMVRLPIQGIEIVAEYWICRET